MNSFHAVLLMSNYSVIIVIIVSVIIVSMLITTNFPTCFHFMFVH